jgi:release factor glutamine methyltransferase
VQLRESLAAAIVRLAFAQVPSPRLNAELLLMFVLNCDRAYLFAHPERELTSDERTRYESSLAKRGHGIPTQYITGHQEFWGMDLIVSPAVLIPRPETEHVVEAVLDLAGGNVGPAAKRRKNAAHGASRGLSGQTQTAPEGRQNPTRLRIIDIGTGSGAIALALAKEFPQAEIHATDISAAALEIARPNAARHQLTDRIHFREADLLAGFSAGCFDFVLSNPPYVGESEEDQVQLEVRKFEPRNAVFAGATGLEVIERLIPQAKAALKPRGWLIMEISGTIADRVRELLKDWSEVAIKLDLQSIPRVAQARKS